MGASMLFLLIGDVQIGKTRWLEKLCGDLAAAGVCVAGVIAPGQWVPRAEGQPGGRHGFDGEGRFEKLGIDNALLPQGERIVFARRRDLAEGERIVFARRRDLAEGERIVFARRRDLAEGDQPFAQGEQAKAAQLAWAISDEAIAQVNDHFIMLAAMGQGDSPFVPFATKESNRKTCGGGSPAATTKPENHPRSSFAFGTAGKESIDGHGPISRNGNVPADTTMGQRDCPFVPLSGGGARGRATTGSASTDGDSAGDHPTAGGALTGAVSASEKLAPAIAPGTFLMVDELGRLELLRGCGLTNAVALLDAGPTPTFPHALTVVRETLLDQAISRFASAWEEPHPIAPEDEARQLILNTLGAR